MTALANIIAGFPNAGVATSPGATPAVPGSPAGIFAGLLASELGADIGTDPLLASTAGLNGQTSSPKTTPFVGLLGHQPDTTGLEGTATPFGIVPIPQAPQTSAPILPQPPTPPQTNGLVGAGTENLGEIGVNEVSEPIRLGSDPSKIATPLPQPPLIHAGDTAPTDLAKFLNNAPGPQRPGSPTLPQPTANADTPVLPVPNASHPGRPDPAGSATQNASAHLQAVAEATPTGRAGTHPNASPVPPAPVQPATDTPRTTNLTALVGETVKSPQVKTSSAVNGPALTPGAVVTPPSQPAPALNAGFGHSLLALQETGGDEQAPTITETGALQSLQSRAPTAHQAALAAPTQLPQVPVNALAVHIAAQAQNGVKRFEIRLDPPELGRIDVRLDVGRDGQVTTHLVVERAETLEMLQRDARTLEKALNDAGLKTNDESLTFSLKDDGLGDDQAGNEETEAGAETLGIDDVNDDEQPDTEPVQSRNYLARDGLDISI